jgi:hypothetical protein
MLRRAYPAAATRGSPAIHDGGIAHRRLRASNTANDRSRHHDLTQLRPTSNDQRPRTLENLIRAVRER